MAFASTMDFSLKDNAVMSRQRQQVHTPIDYGSAITPGQTPTISFSCGNYGQYLDPAMYVEFTIRNADATNNLILDGSAYSLFSGMTLKSSGGVVHDFPNFASFAQIVMDTQIIGSARMGLMSAFAGTSVGDGSTNNNRQGQTIPANSSRTFALPIFAMGITNDASEKLIPVGALTNLELTFTLANTNDMFSHATATAATDYVVSNFKLFCNYTVLDPSAQKQLDAETKGVYKWSTELWKGYEATTSVSSSDTILVPHKSSSIKSIIVAHRLQSGKGKLNAQGNSSRVCNFAGGTGSFQVSIGSELYPQIPIRTTQEAAMELLKMWHGLNVPSAYQTSITADNWVGPDALDNTAGTFMMALNLEAYANKSGVINSGINCTGGNTMNLIMNYNGSTASPAPAITLANSCLTYVHYDAIFEVVDGVLKANW